LSLAIVFLALPVLSVSAAKPDPGKKIEREVLELFRGGGEGAFWLLFEEKADLAGADRIRDWTARGRFVFERLRSVAERSQARIRGELARRGVAYESFWIVNAIRVTGGREVLLELAARPEVASVVADVPHDLSEVSPEGDAGIGVQDASSVATTEWGIDRIGAPLVWSTFGVRGDGIVVADISTGVLYTHPALVAHYRGNLGGGSFDHNYNWRDPSNVCPSASPCDNNGFGTHVIGTMVGDDGDPGTNQIGVAPHAKFISCKGCESSSCSDAALLSCGQWILAPTDLTGANPRPDLRPHVANNGWGTSNGADTFYQATVDAWVAAGIFPSFMNGNSGPACSTSSAPATYLNAYSAGAFDINNVIAAFSSRGPAPAAVGGEIKPNIAAPGVTVRSSTLSNSYSSSTGASMAAAHVSGAVALLWSAAPSLIGDIAATRTLLDDSAIDVENLSCGGTADDNNVWGEGRLDVFAAVDSAPTTEGDLTELSDAHLWIGLKNSDDIGTRFDVKVELLKNDAVVASGLTRCISGVTRNPSLAKEAIVPFDDFDPEPVETGDVLALRVSTRIGTNPDDTKCSGHSNAVGLRLYYDSTSRPSRFDWTISPDSSENQYLHSNGTACGSGPSSGVTTRSLDGTAPTATSAKCKDSGAVSFAGGNPFAVIGVWSAAAAP
jgi:subtilisin family serine protease